MRWPSMSPGVVVLLRALPLNAWAMSRTICAEALPNAVQVPP